jgi:hypothetical protein
VVVGPPSLENASTSQEALNKQSTKKASENPRLFIVMPQGVLA